MRIRAGIILIQDDKVALIERHRSGLDYFVFPGGGVDEGESFEQAAAREAREELGIEVAIKQKVIEIGDGPRVRQVYFLVEQIGGEFGTGTGEEFIEANRADPRKGVYIPIWMPIADLARQANVFPTVVKDRVVRAVKEGWASEPFVTCEVTG